jgi:N-6 DNA Methylase
MNIAEIESKIGEFVRKPYDQESFVFGFLSIFENIPKATLTKLHQGSGNQSKVPGEVLWKKNLFFKSAPKGKAVETVDALVGNSLTKKHAPRFVMSTDGHEFYCRDIKADQSVDVQYSKLNDVFDFFLPLAGIERHEAVAENPADLKATARLANLYDAILEANPDWIGRDHTHELNLFMTRLLFCLFAEHTSIFEHGAFTKTVISMTKEDGSNTSDLLQALFLAMDTPSDEGDGLSEYTRKFPYVNGGLFRDRTPVPQFSRRARRLLKECGDLSWQEINADIFGSMIQAVAQPGLRGDIGMHYTSVPNIMKVLSPLFLTSLEEEFESARDSESKLIKLRDRLYNIKIFDPACGSGNFLIIAYRELRKIENRIFARLKEVAKQVPLAMSGIRLNHFYGIELDDFAVETAKLSLWIAEYQMNEQFKAMFGSAPPALPLKDSGKIVRGNATRLDWLEVCPKADGAEVYVVGNPPYAGSVYQTDSQKENMAKIFTSVLRAYKDLDYVACWLLKGADYCRETKANIAFVATNSICQGEQVAMLWPLIFNRGVEISFAYQSFKWKNNAAKNAAVICIIIGLRLRDRKTKVIFSGNIARQVKNIGPYLIEMDDLVVNKRTVPISSRPIMVKGNQPSDDGNFLLSRQERDELLRVYPGAKKFLKRFYGSQEFIKGIERWSLWIEDLDVRDALEIRPIRERVDRVQKFRKDGKSKQSRDNADTPHRFAYAPHIAAQALLVPRVASERRQYIPVGLMAADVIISDNAYAVYQASDYIFSILSSKLHAVWLSAVGGHMKTDYRYSNTLVYNTFPIPTLSADQRASLEAHAVEILGTRESYPGKTIAWLYDPETMPADLLKTHLALDDTLEHIYIGRRFKNDTERLEQLFRLYAAMAKRGRSDA